MGSSHMQQHPCIQTFEKAHFESVRNKSPLMLTTLLSENSSKRTDYITASSSYNQIMHSLNQYVLYSTL